MPRRPNPCKECQALSQQLADVTEQNKTDREKISRLEVENRILQVEETERIITTATDAFQKLEEEWHKQQKQLSTEIEDLKNKLTDLKQKRQQLSGEIEPEAVSLYEKLSPQKKQPIAKVEQGICRGCRISLSASELQRVRSDNTVQCSNCGRILFLP